MLLKEAGSCKLKVLNGSERQRQTLLHHHTMLDVNALTCASLWNCGPTVKPSLAYAGVSSCAGYPLAPDMARGNICSKTKIAPALCMCTSVYSWWHQEDLTAATSQRQRTNTLHPPTVVFSNTIAISWQASITYHIQHSTHKPNCAIPSRASTPHTHKEMRLFVKYNWVGSCVPKPTHTHTCNIQKERKRNTQLMLTPLDTLLRAWKWQARCVYLSLACNKADYDRKYLCSTCSSYLYFFLPTLFSLFAL